MLDIFGLNASMADPGGDNQEKSDADIYGDSQVKDTEDDEIEKLAKELNINLDSTTKDYLMQYFLNERSNSTAWERNMRASNTQYQRAVADLKKAGLNPFLAFDALSGSSPSASGSAVQGGLYTSKANTQTNKSSNVERGLLSVLAIIAAAVIAAL